MSENPIYLPIDGTLDLHTFKPSDLSTLVDEYIHECLKRDILNIRIIHGKGSGNLRRGVHALLERNPHVISFNLAGEGGGGWGATLVKLSPATNNFKTSDLS